VARMELVMSRKEQSEKYLDQAKIICKELGDPEDLVNNIQEIEKVKDTVDQNRYFLKKEVGICFGEKLYLAGKCPRK